MEITSSASLIREGDSRQLNFMTVNYGSGRRNMSRAESTASLASQRETIKRESVRARSQRRADEVELRFEQRELRRKQKHRGH